MDFKNPEVLFLATAAAAAAGYVLRFLVETFFSSKADTLTVVELKGQTEASLQEAIRKNTETITQTLVSMMEARFKVVPTREEMLTALQTAMVSDHARDLELIQLSIEPIRGSIRRLEEQRSEVVQMVSDMRREMQELATRLLNRFPIP